LCGDEVLPHLKRSAVLRELPVLIVSGFLDEAPQALLELRKEWGSAFDGRLTRAKTAVRQLGGSDMIAVLNESGLGDDLRVIRFMDRVGKLLDAEKTGGVEAKPSAHGSERTRGARKRRGGASWRFRTM